MTFEERCRRSEQCLPNAPYRDKLTTLHNEMLKALAQPERDYERDYERGFIDGMQKQMQSSVDRAVNAMSRPTYYIPGKDQRTWVGLTNEDRASFWTADQMTHEEWQKLFAEVEAKLRSKNEH